MSSIKNMKLGKRIRSVPDDELQKSIAYWKRFRHKEPGGSRAGQPLMRLEKILTLLKSELARRRKNDE